MRLSVTVAAAAALSSFANAHGGFGLPQIQSHDKRINALLAGFKTGTFGIDAHIKSALERLLFNSWLYCSSPGCQYNYGPGCPENQKPVGESTESIPRAKIGSVPYGGNGIYGGFWACKDPGQYDAKATFFITGNNNGKGQIDETQEYIDVIQRMDAEGHQIASHTWTHLDLSKISADLRKNQILNVEGALNNIVGKIPTYIRPPYSSCTTDSGCEQFMQDMGYHIIYFKLDTDDYQQQPRNTFQNSLDWFKGNMTAPELMLKTITDLGYKGVTVGECLGDHKDNWYRKFGDSANRVGTDSASTSASSNPTSTSSQGTPSSSSMVGSSSSSPSDSSIASGIADPKQTGSAASAMQNAGLAYLGTCIRICHSCLLNETCCTKRLVL
ncbi:unnamed protein product [Alternaria alternata]